MSFHSDSREERAMANPNAADGVISREATIGVSCPGGLARQFRVQVTSIETPSRWKLVGSFRDSTEAGRCAANLKATGQLARIIDCRHLPTAA
jgi:hypothetical protein